MKTKLTAAVLAAAFVLGATGLASAQFLSYGNRTSGNEAAPSQAPIAPRITTQRRYRSGSLEI
jgi:hypothetical protein